MRKYNPIFEAPDMRKYIKIFLDGREDHGRYLSFDHCYSFFQKNCNSKDEETIKLMALHLFSYLASWGMLRNSFLMYKDYPYLVDLIKILSDSKKEDYSLRDIMAIKNSIISYFKGPDDNPTTYITNKAERKYVNARKNWDTLTSKVLMGTLGCVPAYDDYFKGVAKIVFMMNPNFNRVGLKHLIAFKDVNSEVIKDLQNETLKCCGFAYPEMKIIDMYFWQKGYSEGISINPR